MLEQEKKEKETGLSSRRKELEAVETSLKRLQEEQKEASEEHGIALDEDDIKQYSKLLVLHQFLNCISCDMTELTLCNGNSQKSTEYGKSSQRARRA